MTSQPVTIEQLARLYRARNDANGRLALAHRACDPSKAADARAQARDFNKAFEAARKQFKQQQKSANRTAQIRFYLDALENQT